MNAAGELWVVLAVERVFGVLNEQSGDLADGVGWMSERESVHEVHGTRRTGKSREANLRRTVACPQPPSPFHTAPTDSLALGACSGLCALLLAFLVRYDSSYERRSLTYVARHQN